MFPITQKYIKRKYTINSNHLILKNQNEIRIIKQKAERLSRLPNDRVLDEKDQDANSILGKISDSISNIAQKIFPDEKSILADENFVPPTLAGRKTPQDVLENKKVEIDNFQD